MRIFSINPVTEKLNGTFELYSNKRLSSIANKSYSAFRKWKSVDISKRCDLLSSLSKKMKSEKTRLAKIITLEVGRPIEDSKKEIEKCCWALDYYAENAEKFLTDESVKTEYSKSYVHFDPMGPVLAVMPWNYPFWQAVRAIAPAIAAGNTMIMKHSNSVPMCALELQRMIEKSGFPSGVFQIALTDAAGVKYLINNENVKAVTFTGSVETGRKIAEIAGKVGKKFVLELGGSDPFIILEDADLRKTCEMGAKIRLQNCGQSCNSPKRFIVSNKLFSDFVEELKEIVEMKKVGDPFDALADVGPLANKNQLRKIISQVNDAKKKGAKIITGGSRLGAKGFFYQPTIITNVKPNMRIRKEEVFGPIFIVMKFSSDEEAIKIANETKFGLGGSVWTRNSKRGEEIAKQIDAGFVSVNKQVTSDPRLPFGGTKGSGVGRELSRYGILEFTNIRTVIVK